jgi:subtilase family serine protease
MEIRMNFKIAGFHLFFFITFGFQTVCAGVVSRGTPTTAPTPPTAQLKGPQTLVPSHSSGLQLLHDHVPKEVKTASLSGDVPGGILVHLAIGLPFRDKKAVDDFIQSTSDANSPNYRKRLNPEQIATMFGPSKKDYQKVVDFLKANGLTITRIYQDRLLVSAKGTAAVVQKTFHVHLHYYKRADGSKFYAPDSDPSVDLDVPLLHVSGLDNHFITRLRHHKVY